MSREDGTPAVVRRDKKGLYMFLFPPYHFSPFLRCFGTGTLSEIQKNTSSVVCVCVSGSV